MAKVYTYYDSLVGKPLSHLEYKIEYSKKLILTAQLIYKTLPTSHTLTNNCNYHLELLDLRSNKICYQ